MTILIARFILAVLSCETKGRLSLMPSARDGRRSYLAEVLYQRFSVEMTPSNCAQLALLGASAGLYCDGTACWNARSQADRERKLAIASERVKARKIATRMELSAALRAQAEEKAAKAEAEVEAEAEAAVVA